MVVITSIKITPLYLLIKLFYCIGFNLIIYKFLYTPHHLHNLPEAVDSFSIYLNLLASSGAREHAGMYHHVSGLESLL